MSNGTGHDIIDNVVIRNGINNMELFNQVDGNPMYYGQVNISAEMLKLDTIKDRKNITPSKITDGIIASAKALIIEDGDAKVVITEDGKTIECKTDKHIVAFIKSCVAGSYTTEIHVSEAVTNFVRSLIYQVNHLCLPIDVNVTDKIGKVVVQELNYYLKELCDTYNIKYTTEMSISTKKKSISKMLNDAEG